MLSEFLDVFSSFVDAKDSYTYGHSRRVAEYSREIAGELGFSEEKCSHVYQVALLHDIGKCFIPDEILKKAGGLSEEEVDPLIGRIITVADAYDAMTSDRVYRGKLTQAQAEKELKDNRGTQFDPEIVDAFLKALKKTGD